MNSGYSSVPVRPTYAPQGAPSVEPEWRREEQVQILPTSDTEWEGGGKAENFGDVSGGLARRPSVAHGDVRTGTHRD